LSGRDRDFPVEYPEVEVPEPELGRPALGCVDQRLREVIDDHAASRGDERGTAKPTMPAGDELEDRVPRGRCEPLEHPLRDRLALSPRNSSGSLRRGGSRALGVDA